jgi:hypothetical protein
MIDLENIEKHEHYEVPENYFEELPGRVMQRIKHEQHRRRNIISGAVAAVAILAIAVGTFFTLNTADKRTDTAQTQLSAAFETDDEVLESLATEYYSEELAMMDYYQYYEY